MSSHLRSVKLSSKKRIVYTDTTQLTMRSLSAEQIEAFVYHECLAIKEVEDTKLKGPRLGVV
ncbi:MAG: hypothetical protein R2827_02935 [Bdellovibrionales bacterium]